MLERLSWTDVPELLRDPVDEATLETVAGIVADVREDGIAAVHEHASRLGDIEEGDELVIERTELEEAADALPNEDREVLERAAGRIRHFARAQLASVEDVTTSIPGGEAGHTTAPVASAGCYAPGGRYPLPSSVLMTAITAGVAGVTDVWVASPRPAPVTLAAAAIAGADALLACGGAQAIAAMAYGAGAIPRCDAVVGPGNRWVTAAKKLVAGRVRIDMLAGPSELVVLADETAEPEVVAADLLAQAEHDVDAMPVLVTQSEPLADAVDEQLEAQLEDLSTAETARQALENGFTVVVPDIEAGVDICDRLAPEHLEVMTRQAEEVARRCSHYGGLFIGESAAEVLGDYGAGPNHTLPTGGTARYTGGLSVHTFLRVRTWMRVDDREAARELVEDSAHLARLERLEAHARAAELRLDEE